MCLWQKVHVYSLNSVVTFKIESFFYIFTVILAFLDELSEFWDNYSNFLDVQFSGEFFFMLIKLLYH